MTIGGTSTPGASIKVVIDGTQQTTTAGGDGTWSVTFPPGTVSGGEREPAVTVTATVGNQTTTVTDKLVIDTLPNPLNINPVTADNTVSGSERNSGFTLSGSTVAGAEVTISIGTETFTRTADGEGKWSVDIAAGSIRAGTYDASVTATTRDTANNPSSTTHVFRVDTESAVAFDAGAIAGNNIVNAGEASRGVVMTGTSEPGSTVMVSWGDTRLPAQSDPVTGAWTVRFTQAQIPADGSRTATVTATDAFGNSASDTRTVVVDTRVEPLTRVSLGAGLDNIVNQSEAQGGITITGTVEAGSTVMVSFGSGTAIPARVVNGTWTVDIPEADIPTGQTSAQLTVTATDANGNTRIHSETVAVDRTVLNFAPSAAPIAQDGIVNAEEAAAGVVVSGTAEAGATIVIRVAGGSPVETTADRDGNWSATLTGTALPRGEIDTTITVTATDRAGNSASYSQPLTIDTIAPGAPDVMGFTRDSRGLTRIQTGDTDESYSFTSINPDGSQTPISAVRTVDELWGTQNVSFGAMGQSGFVGTPVPDGSYLVVNSTDTAGNDSSTLFVVNNTNAPAIDLGREGLDDFTLTAIDLTFAPDAQLTITEADIIALTGPDKTLVVKGGGDDKVSLAGTAQLAGTQEIDGETFTVYTLGPSGARVLLDDDITLT
ncbi:MAG: Ig-like domain-containing protein [Cypionkella sp.]|nr:Ig-like domain-containing protein [Cypionkella sp.]